MHPPPKSKIHPINQTIAVSLILVKQKICCCRYGEYHSRFKRHLASVSQTDNTTIRPRWLFFSVIICALTSSVSDTFGVVEVILFLSLKYASVLSVWGQNNYLVTCQPKSNGERFPMILCTPYMYVRYFHCRDTYDRTSWLAHDQSFYPKEVKKWRKILNEDSTIGFVELLFEIYAKKVSSLVHVSKVDLFESLFLCLNFR